jgi:diphosphomevalonate decarboxylase
MKSSKNKQGLESINEIVWRCPSNIAIVKYWGKKGNQIPCNSSLSMTLSKSFTEIELSLFEKKTNEKVDLNYFFEGKKNVQFEERVKKYLFDQYKYFPFLKEYSIEMNSKNSFPHSAGIASSASAFGAIALSLFDASRILRKQTINEDFFQKSSELARLGSGSASRSMFPEFSLWGKNNSIPDSNNRFAIPLVEIHENFKNLHDTILIVENDPKKVSSSAGHSLMNGHPYAKNRFLQANERTFRLKKVLSMGDFQEFIEIAESEALTLHAMMMTSSDYYLLMKPGTLIAIEKIMAFRKETKIPVCFTLDAGPNVHVLYPASEKNKVEVFLNNTFKNSVKQIIYDQMGEGPEKIR